MLSSLSARPSLQGLRSITSLPRARAPLRVHSVMGGYQYHAKAERMRGKGIDVKEFGSRVLREGCFGEDVLALQNWLAEETYYNPVDGGYTGYFGSVTKESLQAWQRDNGLETTGAFDGASKWHYLNCVEQRAAPAPAAAAAKMKKMHTVAVPSTPVAVERSVQGSTGVPIFAAASILTGIVLLKLVVPTIKRNAATLRNHVAATITSFTTVSEQQHVAAQEVEGVEAGGDVPYSQNAEIDSQEERASRLRRLSEEELQRYIAPMKGSAASRTPLQRPAPRPLKLSRPSVARGTATPSAPTEADAADAAPSKYGMYYGGKQVIDRVKQYLAEENDMPAPAGAHNKRTAAGAYDMRKSRPSPRRPAAAAPQQQQQQRPVSPLRVASPPTPAPTPRAFEDIPAAQVAEEAQQAFHESEALLSGTDLEDEPERPMWRVPVQRSGNRNPLGGGAATSGVATAEAPVHAARGVAVAPRPVAVVKPTRGGESAEAAPDAAVAAPNPSATVVLSHKPIKLHKSARLAAKSGGAGQVGE